MNEDIVQDEILENQPIRKPYIVAVETGIFKNGILYNQGDSVLLDDKTAANFLAIGDIEIIEE